MLYIQLPYGYVEKKIKKFNLIYQVTLKSHFI